MTMQQLEEIVKFDEKGLIPAVIQHAGTGQVLMVGYMNQESLQKTLDGKCACFWSRSRQELWLKGATSGDYLDVEEVRIDCDGDALVLRCHPQGPTCHTKETSCFYRHVAFDGSVSLAGDGVAKK